MVKRLVMVDEAELTKIPALKVCRAVQVLGFERLRDAATAPVVGEMVNVPSEFETEDTPVMRHPEALAKHPEEMVMPFAKDEVELDVEVIAPPPLLN
ncbi:MAG: hypothetical protein QXN96_02510 [Candidatus Bathyarchaeia archaeon]